MPVNTRIVYTIVLPGDPAKEHKYLLALERLATEYGVLTDGFSISRLATEYVEVGLPRVINVALCSSGIVSPDELCDLSESEVRQKCGARLTDARMYTIIRCLAQHHRQLKDSPAAIGDQIEELCWKSVIHCTRCRQAGIYAISQLTDMDVIELRARLGDTTTAVIYQLADVGLAPHPLQTWRTLADLKLLPPGTKAHLADLGFRANMPVSSLTRSAILDADRASDSRPDDRDHSVRVGATISSVEGVLRTHYSTVLT